LLPFFWSKKGQCGYKPGGLRGTPCVFVALPIFQLNSQRGGNNDWCTSSTLAPVVEVLQEVSSAAGLTLEDVVDLLVAGITVTDLLDYAQAAATNRLN
jgi:hypothetical protein